MTEVISTPGSPATPEMGLAARVVNVFVAPRAAYEAVAARPRAFGMLAVVILVMVSAQFIFLSTEVGQNAALDQQISVMKTFGADVTPEMVQQMEARLGVARYINGVSTAVFIPVMAAVMAGLLLAVFTVITGGAATFKQVFAVVAHSQLIGALAQLFTFPISYAQEEITSPTRLSVFFPTLDDMGFAYHLLTAIDLFWIWSTVNLAIGVAVLYKRRTGPIATGLLSVYAVIALIYAAVRAF
jgi:hypothetical protein